MEDAIELKNKKSTRALKIIDVCALCVFILTVLVALAFLVVDKFFLHGSLSFFIINALITDDAGQILLRIGTTLFLPLMTNPNILIEILGLMLPIALIGASILIMRRLRHRLSDIAQTLCRLVVYLCLSILVIAFSLSLVYTNYAWHVVGQLILSDDDYVDTNDFSKIQDTVREDKYVAQWIIDTILMEVKDPLGSLDDLDDAEYCEVAEIVALCFQTKGTVNSSEEHYLRNYFCRAPQTLDGMIQEIRAGSPFAWILMDQGATVYHMQGTDGEYNVKFVSEDGYHEAVYNKEGILLTEKNDPVNMGTFNYASPLAAPALHAVLDILPYYSYGNSLDSPTSSPENHAYQNNPDAQKHWRELQQMIK